MKKLTRTLKSIGAVLLALALAITPMPGKTVDVGAEIKESFTIKLDGYSEGGKIKLTRVNQEAPAEEETTENEVGRDSNDAPDDNPRTETIENGKAVFANFVNTENKYDIEIINLKDCKDYKKKAVSFSGSEYLVSDLQTKIEISGKVIDEKNDEVRDVTVKYKSIDGDLTGEVKTDGNGEYHFDAYKNDPFTVEFSIKNNKYGDQTIKYKNGSSVTFTEDKTLDDVVLLYRQVTIDNSINSQKATVKINNEVIGESTNLKYGNDATIDIIPKDGATLDKFYIDGDEKEITDTTEEKGYISYRYILNNLTKELTIDATFDSASEEENAYTKGEYYFKLPSDTDSYDYYFKGNEDPKPVKIIEGESKITIKNSHELYQIYRAPKGSTKQKKYIKDLHIYLDKTAPKIEGTDNFQIFDYEDDSYSILDKFHNTQFGIFFKNKVKIKVKATDHVGQGEEKASGIKSVALFADGFDENGIPFSNQEGETPIVSSTEDNGYFVFEVLRNEIMGIGEDGKFFVKKVIRAVAIDKSSPNGNGMTAPVYCSQVNSNIEDDNLMLENTEPTIDYKYIIDPDQKQEEETVDGKDWFNHAPKIKFTCTDPNHDTDSIKNDYSGMYSVQVSYKIGKDNYPIDQKIADRENKQQVLSIDIQTKDTMFDSGGKCVLRIEALDNAGNLGHIDGKKEVREITLYKDEKAPFIDKMTFSSKASGYKEDDEVQPTQAVEETTLPNTEPKKNEESDKEYFKKYVEVGDYGYYFKRDTNVTIYADDLDPSSGIKSITYYLIDIDDINKDPIPETKTVVENNSITVPVPKDFKGHIFARATDNVNNTTDNYANPEGTIQESATKHENQKDESGQPLPHIKLKPEPTKYTDIDGKHNLYSKNTTVDVEINDNYSGIRQVDIFVKSSVDDKKQSGSIMINNRGNVKKNSYSGDVKGIEGRGFAVDSTKDWSDDKIKKTEGNLVIQLKNKIKVSNNSNDIKISVRLIDRAGNVSKKELVISIDKTAPKLVVKMNNNDDSQYAGYFKHNRNYDVYLYERNINKKQTKMKTVREDDYGHDHKRSLSTNFKKIGKTMLDGAEVYVYKKSGTFKAEGDYTFTINTKDLANNNTPNKKVKYSKEVKSKKKNNQKKNTQQVTIQTNNKVNADNSKILDYKKQNNKDKKIDTSFTIDKTIPKVTVTYDNNNAVNGKYFPQARTATIKINEHNFTKEHNRIRINKKATKDGSSIGGATMSSWAHKIDTNTYKATIPYTQDGDYQFGIDVTDKAGNTVSDSGVNYPNGRDLSKDFVIDQSVEKPIIGGVENGHSYPEKCIPTIQVNDTNYESSEVKLLRTQKDDIDRDVTSKYIKSMPANGSTVSEDYFDKLKANDGIYKLRVDITDMAGNTDSEEVAFTVNRFGSVYEFSKDLVDLQDSYVNKVDGDIFIREFNPDRLVEDSVELEVQRDQDPVENVKYDVSPEVNNKVDIGSSGWYQYKYDIGNDNFKKDGIYTVNVKTKDDAGNTPESNNQSEIRFSVDTEKPDIVNVKGMESASVNAKEQKVDYLIHDSIGLKSIVVTVDGKEVANVADFADPTNYEGNFVIKEGYQRKVNFKITDLAGNVTNTADTDFNPEYDFNSTITVSTNIFLLWFANKWLFFGSLIGLAAIAAAIAYLIRRKMAGKIL